jgi:hypothetical protein
VVKFFEHIDVANLAMTRPVLLLDPRQYATTAPFGPIAELHFEHFEPSRFTPTKPAAVFHGRCVHETLFNTSASTVAPSMSSALAHLLHCLMVATAVVASPSPPSRPSALTSPS